MRIYITWPAGSGKSTLARKLSQHFDIPLVHLDAIQWLDDWIENPKYLELQKQAIAESDWIIEWASCSIIKSMQGRADLVVILNTPPTGNIFRVIFRTIRGYFSSKMRDDLPIAGWNDLNLWLLYRTCTWKKRQLPRIMENIERSGLTGKCLILNSNTDAFEKILEFVMKFRDAESFTMAWREALRDALNDSINPVTGSFTKFTELNSHLDSLSDSKH